MTRFTFNLSRGALQAVVVLLILAAAIILAATHTWVFSGPSIALGTNPSLWQIILSDPITLGFLKLGLMALGLYVLASVAALMVGGRWIKGFPGGLSADEVVAATTESQEALEQMKSHIAKLKTERDDARRISRQILEGLRG